MQAVPSPPDAELLDQSSLNTVLDMLAVIDSPEELALLEMLTPVQKRQVWDATPEPIKARLKQIRLAQTRRPAQATIALSSVHSAPVSEILETEEDELDDEDLTTAQTIDQPSLQKLEDLQETLQNPLLSVGDRVVLLARLELSVAELKAIWEVVEVQSAHAQLKAKYLGTRRYPLNWLLVYPG